MPWETWGYIGLAVIVAAGFLYLMIRRDTDTDGPDREGEGTVFVVRDLVTQMSDAAVIATVLVQAAEQLNKTGVIEKDARFTYAFSRLKEVFPSLSEDFLIGAIESAVHLVNKGTLLLQEGEVVTPAKYIGESGAAQNPSPGVSGGISSGWGVFGND